MDKKDVCKTSWLNGIGEVPGVFVRNVKIGGWTEHTISSKNKLSYIGFNKSMWKK